MQNAHEPINSKRRCTETVIVLLFMGNMPKRSNRSAEAVADHRSHDPVDNRQWKWHQRLGATTLPHQHRSSGLRAYCQGLRGKRRLPSLTPATCAYGTTPLYPHKIHTFKYLCVYYNTVSNTAKRGRCLSKNKPDDPVPQTRMPPYATTR
jgi:hypothetical protein